MPRGGGMRALRGSGGPLRGLQQGTTSVMLEGQGQARKCAEDGRVTGSQGGTALCVLEGALWLPRGGV